MKPETLLDAIEGIKPEYIAEARPHTQNTGDAEQAESRSADRKEQTMKPITQHIMTGTAVAAALALCAGVWAADTGACADSARTLSLDDYRDKMKAAWVEQMVGVSWGQPMEFKWNDVIIPADKVPEWASDFRSAWRTATTTSTWR